MPAYVRRRVNSENLQQTLTFPKFLRVKAQVRVSEGGRASYVNFGVRIRCSRETFSDELRELPFPHCSLSLSHFEKELRLIVIANELLWNFNQPQI